MLTQPPQRRTTLQPKFDPNVLRGDAKRRLTGVPREDELKVTTEIIVQQKVRYNSGDLADGLYRF